MNARKPIDTAAALTMLVLSALWGTQQVAIKLAAADMAPVLQIGLRSSLAALIVLLIILVRREHRTLASDNWKPGLAAGTLFGLEFVLVAQGLRFTSASHMSIFLYTAPIFAALGLHIRLPEERMAPIQWIGIAIAFTGIVMAFSGRAGPATGDDAWIGDVFGIAAGAVWGATTIVVRTSRIARAPAAVTLWYQLMGAAVLGIASAAVLGETRMALTAPLVASLVYQTLVLSVASFLVWFSLMRVYLVSRLGLFTLMTPIFGIGFGVVILGDSLTREFLAGAALILFGILFVNGRDVLVRRTIRAPILVKLT